MYLNIFLCVYSNESTHKKIYRYICFIKLKYIIFKNGGSMYVCSHMLLASTNTDDQNDYRLVEISKK
jgi:hypothetical protein